jgi:hypothetical protein
MNYILIEGGYKRHEELARKVLIRKFSEDKDDLDRITDKTYCTYRDYLACESDDYRVLDDKLYMRDDLDYNPDDLVDIG